MSAAPLTGIVLGGGRSRRLGANQSKLLTHIGGKLVLARVADILKQVCSELVLVVRPDQDDDIPDLGIALNMHVVTDTTPPAGPRARFAAHPASFSSRSAGFFNSAFRRSNSSRRSALEAKIATSWARRSSGRAGLPSRSSSTWVFSRA